MGELARQFSLLIPFSMQTANDSLCDSVAKSLYLTVFGWRQGNEFHRTVLVGLVIKSIHDENVSMKVEIEKPVEAL